ncbi:hypothetical protein PybrP1_005655 [[Pythium] brassicae (nom. inval.)]|nr:hypothetical protein PybrP1_005655 [[Pythium] brassicae (nom. inval.)]
MATSVAHVRLREGDDHLRLQLRVHGDRKTFYRPVGERWDKLRGRLQLLAAPGSNPNAVASKAKKNHRARQPQQHQKRRPPSAGSAPAAAKAGVHFFSNDGHEFVSKDLPIGDVLMQTARIEIGDTSYVVLHNQPLVAKLSVAQPVLAGIPIVPIVETEFCSPDDCVWRWLRLSPSSAASASVGGGASACHEDAGSADAAYEELCSNSRRYLPTDADIGCRFRVECHAPAMHEAYAQDSKSEIVTSPVVRGPNREVFRDRRRLGRTRAHDSEDGECSAAFRVMSYNILFNGYTTSARGKEPMFPYASPAVLNEMYRMQLVFQEIEECNADIVCLQEMGEATFTSFFNPALRPTGFETFYSGKTGSTQEGCAVFVRTDAFEVVEKHTVDLSMVVKHSPDPTIRGLLAAFPELGKAFDKIPSVAQLLLLRSKRDPTKHLVLSNTHLFYRADAHLVRLLQTVVMVREASKLRLDTGGHVGLVLCGDLNAFPGTAPIRFLLDASIDSSHPHWQDAMRFKWKLTENSNTNSSAKKGNKSSTRSNNRIDSDSEPLLTAHSKAQEGFASVASGSFRHDLALESACGIPDFTNFAGTFIGTLDYILIGRECLHVQQVFPLFTAEDASSEVALPSSRFPSDHISLVCDVVWHSSSLP